MELKGIKIDGRILAKNFAVANPNPTYTTANLLHTLDNPNAYGSGNSDYFGTSVAISGNYAIVGAYNEDKAGITDSGKAYIFNVATGALVHTLDNPNAYGESENDYFGREVSIDGNYAMVGVQNEDDAAANDSGKAYIFNVTTGELVWTLSNPNYNGINGSDLFGSSVAVSGNYAVVGAYDEDSPTGTNSGVAFIYTIANQSYHVALVNPVADGNDSAEQFGRAVAISGEYVIVGARYNSGTGGKAYIYNASTGALVHALDNPSANDPTGDQFGNAVAINGNYALVSAYAEDDASGSESGKVYVFNVTTGALLHTLDNPNAYGTSVSDYFGYSVSISGNYAIIGALLEDDAGGSASSKAYIFNVTTGALVITLDNPNAYGTSANDMFGYSVSISGNYAIVGAYYEDDAVGTNSGKAYIYQLT